MQANANHLGHEQIQRPSKHYRFSFDAANPPAYDSEAIDHGGMRVRPDQTIWHCQPLPVRVTTRLHYGCQVLQVDLVDDARTRRHKPKVLESLLRPTQKQIPFAVLRDFQLNVLVECFGGAREPGLDRVIDHEVSWHHRVDSL